MFNVIYRCMYVYHIMRIVLSFACLNKMAASRMSHQFLMLRNHEWLSAIWFFFLLNICQAGRFFIPSSDLKLTQDWRPFFKVFPAIAKFCWTHDCPDFPFCTHHRFPLLSMTLKDDIFFIPDVRIIPLFSLSYNTCDSS